MKIDEFQIDAIETCIFHLDGGAMFGVVPKVLWSKSYDSGDELNRIPLAARPLLIRYENKNILIDTGNGNKWNEKLASMYDINIESSNPENYLKKFGLKPSDITDVIFTHLHFDHAGGATIINKNNNQIEPTFPNAKYYVQKQHYEWALNPCDKDRASFFPENFQILKSDGLLNLLEGEGEIFPGIKVIPVFGHTPAMQLVLIGKNNQKLLYCADLCATSAHIPVVYAMGYDNHPLITIEEKKKYMTQAYDENWILFFEHDAKIQASRIIKTNKSFAVGEKVEI